MNITRRTCEPCNELYLVIRLTLDEADILHDELPPLAMAENDGIQAPMYARFLAALDDVVKEART